MGSDISVPHQRMENRSAENEDGGDFFIRYGVSSFQGWRANNEDSHVAIIGWNGDPEHCFFGLHLLHVSHYLGIFDGHGGAEVAKYVSHHLPGRFFNHPDFKLGHFVEAMRKAYLLVDCDLLKPEGRKWIAAEWRRSRGISTATSFELESDTIDPNISSSGAHVAAMANEPDPYSMGCTAACVYFNRRTRQLVVANAGDSRIIAILSDGKAFQLTKDHKPDNPIEFQRIRSAGGKVDYGRINGSLNLSRALGDWRFKSDRTLTLDNQMITANPEVYEVLADESVESIILGCDGIWERPFAVHEVAKFVRNRLDFSEKYSLICEEIANRLCPVAIDRANLVTFLNNYGWRPETREEETLLSRWTTLDGVKRGKGRLIGDDFTNPSKVKEALHAAFLIANACSMNSNKANLTQQTTPVSPSTNTSSNNNASSTSLEENFWIGDIRRGILNSSSYSKPPVSMLPTPDSLLFNLVPPMGWSFSNPVEHTLLRLILGFHSQQMQKQKKKLHTTNSNSNSSFSLVSTKNTLSYSGSPSNRFTTPPSSHSSPSNLKDKNKHSTVCNAPILKQNSNISLNPASAQIDWISAFISPTAAQLLESLRRSSSNSNNSSSAKKPSNIPDLLFCPFFLGGPGELLPPPLSSQDRKPSGIHRLFGGEEMMHAADSSQFAAANAGLINRIRSADINIAYESRSPAASNSAISKSLSNSSFSYNDVVVNASSSNKSPRSKDNLSISPRKQQQQRSSTFQRNSNNFFQNARSSIRNSNSVTTRGDCSLEIQPPTPNYVSSRLLLLRDWRRNPLYDFSLDTFSRQLLASPSRLHNFLRLSLVDNPQTLLESCRSLRLLALDDLSGVYSLSWSALRMLSVAKLLETGVLKPTGDKSWSLAMNGKLYQAGLLNQPKKSFFSSLSNRFLSHSNKKKLQNAQLWFQAKSWSDVQDHIKLLNCAMKGNDNKKTNANVKNKNKKPELLQTLKNNSSQFLLSSSFNSDSSAIISDSNSYSEDEQHQQNFIFNSRTGQSHPFNKKIKKEHHSSSSSKEEEDEVNLWTSTIGTHSIYNNDGRQSTAAVNDKDSGLDKNQNKIRKRALILRAAIKHLPTDVGSSLLSHSGLQSEVEAISNGMRTRDARPSRSDVVIVSPENNGSSLNENTRAFISHNPSPSRMFGSEEDLQDFMSNIEKGFLLSSRRIQPSDDNTKSSEVNEIPKFIKKTIADSKTETMLQTCRMRRFERSSAGFTTFRNWLAAQPDSISRRSSSPYASISTVSYSSRQSSRSSSLSSTSTSSVANLEASCTSNEEETSNENEVSVELMNKRSHSSSSCASSEQKRRMRKDAERRRLKGSKALRTLRKLEKCLEREDEELNQIQERRRIQSSKREAVMRQVQVAGKSAMAVTNISKSIFKDTAGKGLMKLRSFIPSQSNNESYTNTIPSNLNRNNYFLNNNNTDVPSFKHRSTTIGFIETTRNTNLETIADVDSFLSLNDKNNLRNSHAPSSLDDSSSTPESNININSNSSLLSKSVQIEDKNFASISSNVKVTSTSSKAIISVSEDAKKVRRLTSKDLIDKTINDKVIEVSIKFKTPHRELLETEMMRRKSIASFQFAQVDRDVVHEQFLRKVGNPDCDKENDNDSMNINFLNVTRDKDLLMSSINDSYSVSSEGLNNWFLSDNATIAHTPRKSQNTDSPISARPSVIHNLHQMPSIMEILNINEANNEPFSSGSSIIDDDFNSSSIQSSLMKDDYLPNMQKSHSLAVVTSNTEIIQTPSLNLIPTRISPPTMRASSHLRDKIGLWYEDITSPLPSEDEEWNFRSHDYLIASSHKLEYLKNKQASLRDMSVGKMRDVELLAMRNQRLRLSMRQKNLKHSPSRLFPNECSDSDEDRAFLTGVEAVNKGRSVANALVALDKTSSFEDLLFKTSGLSGFSRHVRNLRLLKRKGKPWPLSQELRLKRVTIRRRKYSKLSVMERILRTSTFKYLNKKIETSPLSSSTHLPSVTTVQAAYPNDSHRENATQISTTHQSQTSNNPRVPPLNHVFNAILHSGSTSRMKISTHNDSAPSDTFEDVAISATSSIHGNGLLSKNAQSLNASAEILLPVNQKSNSASSNLHFGLSPMHFQNQALLSPNSDEQLISCASNDLKYKTDNIVLSPSSSDNALPLYDTHHPYGPLFNSYRGVPLLKRSCNNCKVKMNLPLSGCLGAHYSFESNINQELAFRLTDDTSDTEDATHHKNIFTTSNENNNLSLLSESPHIKEISLEAGAIPMPNEDCPWTGGRYPIAKGVSRGPSAFLSDKPSAIEMFQNDYAQRYRYGHDNMTLMVVDLKPYVRPVSKEFQDKYVNNGDSSKPKSSETMHLQYILNGSIIEDSYLKRPNFENKTAANIHFCLELMAIRDPEYLSGVVRKMLSHRIGKVVGQKLYPHPIDNANEQQTCIVQLCEFCNSPIVKTEIDTSVQSTAQASRLFEEDALTFHGLPWSVLSAPASAMANEMY